MAQTIAELFAELRRDVDPELIKDIDATFQWDITGEGGGKWFVTVSGGAVEIVEGEGENPTLSITVAAKVWLAIATGKRNAKMAFLTGKIRLKGDLSLALKLQNLMG